MPPITAVLTLALALLTPQNKPSQVPAATVAATPAEDPAVNSLARKIYAQMRAGKVDEALLTPEMNAALTPAVLAQSKPMFDQLGDPTKLTLEGSTAGASNTTYVYLATFATAQFHVILSVNSAGRVSGYLLKP